MLNLLLIEFFWHFAFWTTMLAQQKLAGAIIWVHCYKHLLFNMTVNPTTRNWCNQLRTSFNLYAMVVWWVFSMVQIADWFYNNCTTWSAVHPRRPNPAGNTIYHLKCCLSLFFALCCIYLFTLPLMLYLYKLVAVP